MTLAVNFPATKILNEVLLKTLSLFADVKPHTICLNVYAKKRWQIAEQFSNFVYDLNENKSM